MSNTVIKFLLKPEVTGLSKTTDLIEKELKKVSSFQIGGHVNTGLVKQVSKSFDEVNAKFQKTLITGVAAGFGFSLEKRMEKGAGKFRTRMMKTHLKLGDLQSQIQNEKKNFESKLNQAKSEDDRVRIAEESKIRMQQLRKKIKKEQEGQKKIQGQMDKHLQKEEDRIKKIEESRKALKELKVSQQFEDVASGLQDAAQGFKGADPFALADASKRISQGMAKALSTSVQKMGAAASARGDTKEGMSGMALSGVGAALGGLGKSIGLLGALAGSLAAVIKLFIDMDAQHKEYNRTLLEGVGPLDMVSSGSKGLANSLQEVRQAIQDTNNGFMSSNNFLRKWGISAQEGLQILNSFSQAGYTFKEMAAGISESADRMKAFQSTAQAALVYSKLLGTTAPEMASTMAEHMEDFGLTLKGVQERFSQISTAAQLSGFGTKRFFGTILEVTSGMQMYNVRVSEAAGLLVRLGKILGTRTGGDFLKSLTKAFSGLNMQDRMKKVMLAGQGRVASIFAREAENTASDFLTKLGGKLKAKEFSKMLGEIGINVPLKSLQAKSAKERQAAAKSLASQLQKLDPKQQTKLIGKIALHDGDLARQMSTLLKVTEGSKGNLGSMSKNLDALGPGGALAVQFGSAMQFFKKPLHELSAIQLAGFESFSGMSGEQLEQLRRVSQGLHANYSALEDVKNSNKAITEKQQHQQIKAFGAYVKKQADGTKVIQQAMLQNGKIVDSGTKPLENFQDYLLTQGKTLKKATAKGVPEQTRLARETASQTTEMTKVLKQGVEYYLSRIYDTVNAILNWLPGGMNSTEKANKQALIQSSSDSIKAIRDQRESLGKKLSQLEREAQGAKGGDLSRIQSEIEKTKKKESALAVKQSLEEQTLDKLNLLRGGKTFGSYTQEQLLGQAKEGLDPKKVVMNAGMGKQFEKIFKEAEGDKLPAKEQKKLQWEILKTLMKSQKQEATKKSQEEQKRDREKSVELLKKAPDKFATAYAKAFSEEQRTLLAKKLEASGFQGSLQEFVKEGAVSKELKGYLSSEQGKQFGEKISSTELAKHLINALPMKAGNLAPNKASNDFLLRMSDSGALTVLNKFSSADNLIVGGTKSGGEIQQAANKGGGTTAKGGLTNVNITINGNEEKAYNVVLNALKQAGVY